MKLTKTIFAFAVAALGMCNAAHAQILTDITLFRLNAANDTVYEGWNTRGSDSISNLYLLSGGIFVNSGNGSATSSALDLSTPGTYTFAFAGENVNSNTATALGINLYFDGEGATPGISARGTGTTNNAGSFVASGGIGNTPNYAAVAGVNTLTFVSGGRTVTLSGFSYNTSTGADQVTSFNNAPGGTGDTIGSLTLTVAASAAPEPSALCLIVPALFGGAWYRRKRLR